VSLCVSAKSYTAWNAATQGKDVPAHTAIYMV